VFRRLKRLLDELDEPIEGCLAILLLCTVLPGFDHQYSIGVDALTRQLHQAVFHRLGKRRGHSYIKPQLDRRGDFVYILSSWSAGARENKFDLLLIDMDRWRNLDHHFTQVVWIR
jgi:hypothetical protein